MDPITVGTAAYGALRVFNACARGAQESNKTAGYARRRYRLLGTYDVAWLGLDFEASAGATGFTADQLADVGRFLASDSVQPVMALLAIANLATAADEALIEHIANTFRSESAKWNSNKSDSWHPHADAIWKRLNSLHKQILPTNQFDDGWQADIEYYEDYVNTPLRWSAGPGNYRNHFVKQLVTLAVDLPRLRQSYDVSQLIASLIASTSLEPIITHTEIGFGRQASFDSLYIDRSFVDVGEEATFDSSVLTSDETPFRIIVTGAPGAGKSTFVQRFRSQMCRQQSRPVFTLRCREYAAANWDRTALIDFALDRYNAEYSEQIEHSTIRDMFILGRAILVLDGLDEVTDPLRRVELVKRINALAALYPLASMLVTSREVGYSRAPLEAALFTHLRLKEFSYDQAHTYVEKWFNLVERPDLIDRFIYDSDTIPDLRLNPLMLSLLCLLYRESGTIPSRRLDIYAECARLLFHRWDSHRQIQVEGAIPDFSDNLMQEIARWFFTSPTAQAGLDETVITGMLKRILIDQSGFPEGKAEAAAFDFLEFCAGRAWLLGSIGSNYRGERLFSFTHKTFYEYFAAESFARHATDVGEICDRIKLVYANDSSSVLPELLIQSYGKHSAQGSVRVMKELGHSAPPVLLLRLMEGATLPAHSRRVAFDRLAYQWDRGRQTPAELVALLQLNPLARDQFLSENLEPNQDLRRQFLSGWAGIVLSGRCDRYVTSWGPTVEQLISMSSVDTFAANDEAIWSLLAITETSLEIPSDTDLLLVCDSEFGKVPGVAWYAVEQNLRQKHQNKFENHNERYTQAVLDALNGGHKISSVKLRSFAEALEFGGSELGWTVKPGSLSNSNIYFHVYSYLALALNEHFSRTAGETVRNLWAGSLRDVVEVRRLKRDGIEPDADLRGSATQSVAGLPPRIAKWMLNCASLVRS